LSPRRPRPDLRDKREQEILEAAAAVFAERGFRKTRVADVAERAGIGKGTVYEYFRSKEDLFLRLFDWYTSEAFTSMRAELQRPTGSAVDALRRSGETLLAICQQMLPLYPLTMEFWSASTAPEFKDRLVDEFRELYRRFRGALSGAIREGIERGELSPQVKPEAVAAVLVSAYDGLFLQAWFDPSFDPVASGRHFLEVLLRGMATDAKVPGDAGPGKSGRTG
jgi:TetR/AcrR family transcriptional regulator, repressor for uid operon